MSVIVKSGVPGKIPTTSQLDYGQLALNYADQKIYFKNSANQIVQYGVGLTGDQTVAGVKTFSSVAKFTGNYIDLEGGAPTIVFKDSDGSTAFWHNNGNLFYLLRGNNGTGYGEWTQVGDQWPLTFNLSTNAATFGGLLTGNKASYLNPSLGSGGFNVHTKVSYNDSVSHSIGVYTSTCMFVHVSDTTGVQTIPIFPNAGAGVAFAYSRMDPDGGTWAYSSSGLSVSWAAAGTSPNSYTLSIAGGNGTLSIQRTAGTAAYTVSVQLFAIA